MSQHKKNQTPISEKNNRYYIDGIRNNNPKILNEIYQKYSKVVIQYVTSNSGTTEDARDVFQEGMIVLFRKVHSPDFTLTSSFLTYFYAICKFIWSNKLKKRRMKTTEIEKSLELADTTSIEKDIDRKERMSFYQKKFQQLGEGCRKVLTLFYEGAKMKKIAELMGFASANYATKRKYKCKEQLMKLIKEDTFYDEIKLV